MSFEYQSVARLQKYAYSKHGRMSEELRRGQWLHQTISYTEEGKTPRTIRFGQTEVSRYFVDLRTQTGFVELINPAKRYPMLKHDDHHWMASLPRRNFATDSKLHATPRRHGEAASLVRFSESMYWKAFISFFNLHFTIIHMGGREFRLYHMHNPPVPISPCRVPAEQGGKEIEGHIHLVGILYGTNVYLKDLTMFSAVEELQFLCVLAAWAKDGIVKHGNFRH